MFGTSGTLLSGMTCTCSEIVFRPSGLTSGGGGEGACATSARGESTATANNSPPRVRRILPPAGCRGCVRRRFAPDVSQIARRRGLRFEHQDALAANSPRAPANSARCIPLLWILDADSYVRSAAHARLFDPLLECRIGDDLPGSRFLRRACGLHRAGSGGIGRAEFRLCPGTNCDQSGLRYFDGPATGSRSPTPSHEAELPCKRWRL